MGSLVYHKLSYERRFYISLYILLIFIDSKNYSGLVKEFILLAYVTACLKLHPEFAR